MDVKNIDPRKLIDMIESEDPELSNLGKEITENMFGQFNNDKDMITYLEHIIWFKEVVKCIKIT